MKDDKNNLILTLGLTALILLGWQFLAPKFFPQLAQKPVATGTITPGKAGTAPAVVTAPVQKQVPVAQALSTTSASRLAIETPTLKGSLNLAGARIDDLVLTKYKETLDKGSPDVRLFAPGGTDHSYFAGLGWTGQGLTLPDANTVWKASGNKLTPTTPVTLSWDNGQGQLFQIDLKVDENYLFTATQKLSNTSANAVSAAPYAYVNRLGIPTDPDSWTIHIGPMGVFDNAADYGVNYEDIDAAGQNGIGRTSTGGWIGFTDKYWLAAVVPDQKAKVNTALRATPGVGGKMLYQANFEKGQDIIAPGKMAQTTNRIFAGAKETAILDGYADAGINKLDFATDWGWFYWFEKPIFYVLHWLFTIVGNFGVAIMLLTLVVRGLMFPIAQKQFHSMAHMRIVQPKMKQLQEKHKDDKTRLQQEMMKLYKEEKINPFAGCLPILIQIPVFYALYKVLRVSIEMRHQPFALWIKDLSAPDPLHILNLFGLLDFSPPAFLGIGVLALLLGITMWLQFKLNPAQMDPIQQKMFSIMPWMMMFVMAPFAAGLLLYWITSNILTIAQQKWLYNKYPQLKEPLAKMVTHDGPKAA